MMDETEMLRYMIDIYDKKLKEVLPENEYHEFAVNAAKEAFKHELDGMAASETIKNVRTIQKGYLKLIEQKVDEGTFLTDDFEGTWKANTPLTEIYKRNAESLEVAITALEENSKLKAMVDKYEYHIDHTDCIWYRVGGKVKCPVTCSQYRDGWNDAMRYIFKGGEGYKPYRRGVKASE